MSSQTLCDKSNSRRILLMLVSKLWMQKFLHHFHYDKMHFREISVCIIKNWESFVLNFEAIFTSNIRNFLHSEPFFNGHYQHETSWPISERKELLWCDKKSAMGDT